jgi:hypothetical protein
MYHHAQLPNWDLLKEAYASEYLTGIPVNIYDQ